MYLDNYKEEVLQICGYNSGMDINKETRSNINSIFLNCV